MLILLTEKKKTGKLAITVSLSITVEDAAAAQSMLLLKKTLLHSEDVQMCPKRFQIFVNIAQS